MATLSYSAVSDYPFVPFTKIYSADINDMFSIIQTFINTPYNFNRYGTSSALSQGTANYAVFNDSNGNLTEAASLPTTAGGLGFIPTISAATALEVVQVNSSGTGFTLGPTPPTPTNSLYNYFNLG